MPKFVIEIPDVVMRGVSAAAACSVSWRLLEDQHRHPGNVVVRSQVPTRAVETWEGIASYHAVQMLLALAHGDIEGWLSRDVADEARAVDDHVPEPTPRDTEWDERSEANGGPSPYTDMKGGDGE